LLRVLRPVVITEEMKLLLYTYSDGKRANRNSVIAAGGIKRGMLAAMVLGQMLFR
jgi:hypothetical protein